MLIYLNRTGYNGLFRLNRQGAFNVLVGRYTNPTIRALYDGNPDAREAGLRAIRVPARRAINSKATKRRPVGEYVVTNIPARRALAARRQWV